MQYIILRVEVKNMKTIKQLKWLRDNTGSNEIRSRMSELIKLRERDKAQGNKRFSAKELWK